MARSHGIHWPVPARMFGGLMAAILLAAGHHVFYRSLAGTTASGTAFTLLGSDISRQQFNGTVGIALAFLVKAALVYAARVAYVQQFWRTVTSPSVSTTLGRLDALSHAPDDFSVLFNVPLWWWHPLIMAVACITWLIPIASIITPATLSTRQAPVYPVPVHPRFVPRADFSSMKFLDNVPTAGLIFSDPDDVQYGGYTYNGPSQQLLGTASSAMTSGALLAIAPPAPNASWVLDFAGPAIKCQTLTSPEHEKVLQNFHSYQTGTRAREIFYMSWYSAPGGQSSANGTSQVPFIPSDSNGTLQFSAGTPSGALRLFLPPSRYVNDSIGPVDPMYNVNGTSLECNLFNATYSLSFNYENNIQHVKNLGTDVNTRDPIPRHHNILGPLPTENTSANHPFACPSHEVRSKLLSNASGLDATTAPCVFDPIARQTLGNQATMDAFTRMLEGSIHFDGGGGIARNTSVLSTPLMWNMQLAVLANRMPSMQSILAEQGLVIEGVDNSRNDAFSQLPLTEALEQMFQNVTISLMATQSLHLSNTSQSAVNVTLPALTVVYVYSTRKFWLAYGLDILITTVAVIVGAVESWRSNASYSNNFSTVFRAARGAEISSSVEQDELDGRDPLPKHLAVARLALACRNGRGQRPGDAACQALGKAEDSHELTDQSEPRSVSRSRSP